ncbi:hypothetical protein L3Q67_41395 [Saccharothrix sp. AJ9571]|nr:hypothetical protein L3Q67_41395 [Saccharothrix sp. AJ9571]
MKPIMAGVVLVAALLAAACGVSTQDRPERLPVAASVADATPAITQLPGNSAPSTFPENATTTTSAA